MPDQPKPCRSTQHCAVHDFCHRCTPSLDGAVRHLVKAISAAEITTGSGDVYAQLAATVRDAARTAAGRPAGPLTHAAAADAAAWAIAHEKAAARQTTGQDDTWPIATPCGYCAHTLNWHVTGGRCRVTAGENGCGCTAFVAPDGSHPDTAGQPDPTTADNPTPLRWGLGDILHGDDDTTTVCLSGPNREPYWLELDPERAAAFRRDLTPPAAEDTIGLCGYCGVPRENHHHGYTSTADVIAASPYSRTDDEPAPAVGQPAEAHGTEARPPRVQWHVEGYGADQWNPLGLPEDDRETAVAKRAAWGRRLPGVPTRLVRETTTWTVEDER